MVALHGGTWVVGIVATDNRVGLEEYEVQQMGTSDYKQILEKAHQSLCLEGAHYTIDNLAEFSTVIDDINNRLAKGEKP